MSTYHVAVGLMHARHSGSKEIGGTLLPSRCKHIRDTAAGATVKLACCVARKTLNPPFKEVILLIITHSVWGTVMTRRSR